MPPIDPTRILHLAQTLESGTKDEKLDLIASLDAADPIASGVLLRALGDDSGEVKLSALRKLDEADVRPPDSVLDELLDDDDDEIRELAEQLSQRPDTLNPLEKLVPLVEQIADSLGPLGGLLRNMIQTLRGIGEGDERSQLMTVTRLSDENPAAVLVVHQALQSDHISVRIAALRKAVELDGVTIPEVSITQFATDPSEDVRRAAEAVIRAGKVAAIDENELRTKMMESLMQSMLGQAGMGGMGGLDLGSLFQQMGDRMGATGEPEVSVNPHVVDGFIYVVGDERLRDRLVASLTRLSGGPIAPDYQELEHPEEPSRWAIRPSKSEPSAPPGWVEKLAECGLRVDARRIAAAEQARHLSQQVWGAAYADHSGDVELTLAFHDGILSRAEWAGENGGAWSIHSGSIEPTEDGPMALLNAFLDDPTDDKLTPLGEAWELYVL